MLEGSTVCTAMRRASRHGERIIFFWNMAALLVMMLPCSYPSHIDGDSATSYRKMLWSTSHGKSVGVEAAVARAESIPSTSLLNVRLRGGVGKSGGGGWRDMYLKPGFISVCEARFEAETAGKWMKVEDEGKVVRNVEYGPCCTRTDIQMKQGGSSQVHYIEMELQGGTAPDPDFKGIEFEGKWIPYEQDGTIACSIGVIASEDDEPPRHLSETTIPVNGFVWYRRGQALWWYDECGDEPALADLKCSEVKDSLELGSGDRVGVLVDLHGNRLGFFRNGTLVKELKRDLSSVVPPNELRFVVGGMRAQTTWTIVPPAQAWQSLKAVDWDEWREIPDCDSVLRTMRAALTQDLWRKYLRDMGDKIWSDPAASQLFPGGPEEARAFANEDINASPMKI